MNIVDSRRRALVVSALSAGTLSLPGMAVPRASPGSAPVTTQSFLQLACQLTGRSLSSLDPGLAERMLAHLDKHSFLPRVAALVADPSGDPELAASLLATWYSGVFPGDLNASQVGFQHALVWTSAPFLHMPGQCGGATGHWATAPG